MRNRYWRKNKALLLAAGLVLGVCLFYAVALPLLQAAITPAAGPYRLPSAPRLLIWSRTVECIIALWFFMLGGSIGSFLNVVVWRMPLGMSIAAGGSRCPFCRTAILSSDNVPIFGWLKLRGRCRACRLPISPRYPLVELSLALTFLLLAYTEVYFACYSLPLLNPPATSGFDAVFGVQRWDIAGVYVYHVTLMALLTGAALFARDNHRIPLTYQLFAVLVACAPVLWPTLHMAAMVELPPVFFASSMQAALSVLAGASAGALGGLVSYHIVRQIAGLRSAPAGSVAMFTWLGGFLGWKLVVVAGPVAMLLGSVLMIVAARRWPLRAVLPASICVAVVLLLLRIDVIAGYPLYACPALVLAPAGGLFWLLSALLSGYVTGLCQLPENVSHE